MPEAVRGWLALVGLMAGCGSAAAQGVQWRQDYAAARKEAAETGRPLLLDFGSENCIWCQRLDASTFRNPQVVALLNERFVPVKVDGNREERLTQALGVTGFPTLIFAGPDGRVLGRKDGFIDAAGMAVMLGQAAARAKPPAPAPAPRPVADDVAAAPPTPAPSPPPPPPAAAKSPAAGEMAAAREDYEAGRFLACLERCRAVQAAGAGTPEADEAGKLARRVTADPGAWRQACDQLTARLDEAYPKLDLR